MIFIRRAFLQNIMDSCQCTLGKDSFLFDQLVIFFFDQIKFPLHLIHKLTGTFTIFQTILVSFAGNSSLHKSGTLFYKLFPFLVIFAKNLTDQFFNCFLITVKAVCCRKNCIFFTVTVVNFLYQNFLNSNKIFFLRQFLKIGTHSILHIGKKLSQPSGRLECVF